MYGMFSLKSNDSPPKISNVSFIAELLVNQNNELINDSDQCVLNGCKLSKSEDFRVK